jgi:elongation factor 1-gamma
VPEDPNAPLDMDWWKRLYSNTKEKDYPEMWAKFWNKIEADGGKNWFIFFSDYLYAGDYSQQFMLSNLIGGFFQRLDPVRKVAFGSVIIGGADNKFKVRGAWLFRKKEHVERAPKKKPAKKKDDEGEDDVEVAEGEKVDYEETVEGDFPRGVKEGADFESWKFWKGDSMNPQDRKLFQEICEWEGTFGLDVPYLDGKVFK